MVALLTIKSVGLLSVALLAPNALQMFKLFGNQATKKQSLFRALLKLERSGYVVKNSKGFYRLTKLGERETQNFEFQTKKKRRWDRKWRVVMFDITGGKNNIRNRIREYLQNVGFVKLQQSVWVYPYECKNIIDLLRIEFKLRKWELVYIEINEFGYFEKELRKSFKLPE